jgi:hypothetical protein
VPADVPLLTETWPGATVFDALPESPYGTTAFDIGRIDARHLLAVSPPAARLKLSVRPGSLWSYAPADRSYRQLIKNPPFPPNPESVMLTPNRLVYLETQGGGMTKIWFAPRSGRTPRLVARLMSKDPARDIYADDQNVYYTLRSSALPGSGVMRVSLTDGTAERLPAFDNMFTYGAPWAINVGVTDFRYLATGEERRAVRPRGADHFECVPAFCLVHDAGGWFLQQVDGSGRTKLPYTGTPQMVGGFSTRPDAAGNRVDAGLLLLEGGLLLDPVRGKLGLLTREPHCGAAGGWMKDELVVQWWTPRPDGKCDLGGPVRKAYIGASD